MIYNYLHTWVAISVIIAAIRAAILQDDCNYTPIVLEDPRKVHSKNLTWFGNLVLKVCVTVYEFILTPYVVLTWLLSTIFIKPTKEN